MLDALLAATHSQQQIGRAFLLLVVLIIVGVLLVLGLILAGFAHFARRNTDIPERKERFKGVDAWAESGRRAGENDDAEDEPDWEADEDDRPPRG